MFFQPNSRKQNGFTLIELLVVISIIGLLSSVVLASLNSARDKAREAKKLSELQQLTKALALYHDSTGNFPVNRTPTCNCWCVIGVTQQDGGYCLQKLEVAGYFSKLPISPDGNGYYYYNYGFFAMVATRLIPPRYGPGSRGWHCSDAEEGMSDKIYCIEYDK